jgi:hypothetical protein
MKRKKRDKNKNPKFLIIFFIFGFLSALVFFLFIYLKLKKSELLFLSRANFVFIDQEKVPLIFSFEGKNGLILTLPTYDKFRVTRGFGEYELRKVFALGELDKKGGELVSETLEENVPVAIFGYFYDEENKMDSYLKSPRSIFFKVFYRGLRGEIKTSLDKFDLLLLLIKSIKISPSLVELKNYEPERGDLFKDKKMREESLSIEVLNATEQSGLAQRIAELFEKSGGRVVRIADAPQKQENCRIVTSENPTSYTFKWIKQLYHCPVEMENGEARADITIILGENYWKNEGEKW